jgi:DNA-directed RNA polymerase specialized sigma24 family protein
MSYDDQKKRRDREYTDAYREWVARLSPRKRRELAAQGLLEPVVDRLDSMKGEDVSDLPIAAPENPANPDDQGSTNTGTAVRDEEAVFDALRRIIGELLSEANARLSLECLALVTGVAFDGSSMSDIARRHGITRAAVSKRCIALCEQLHLGKSRAMRSLTARANCKAIQIKTHESRERFNHRGRTRPRH